MDRLEEIVEQMESGKMMLEELIVRYEEGMKLVKVCQERLASAEQRIEIITRNNAGKPMVKDFEPAAGKRARCESRTKKEKPPMTKSDSSEPASAQRLLDGIRSPADVKALREQDLPQLAQEVRDELIKVLSQTGGHLGPNLGVVELTIALHRVFETPRDKFVFDVSHQGYVHKMFTGRLDRIGTMRQYQGLNGFLLRTESEHDCYGAGHAGTALSAGLGMAVGRDLRGGNENVVVVAGDAAFTCGISYEALNNAKSQTRRFIVVLNDNEWSIAKNVGAIASYLNNIVANPTYAGLHDKARRFIEAIAGTRCGRVRAQSRGGREELARAQRDLRGAGLALLRPHRRPRHSPADEDIRVPQDPGRAGPPAHSDQERERL